MKAYPEQVRQLIIDAVDLRDRLTDMLSGAPESIDIGIAEAIAHVIAEAVGMVALNPEDFPDREEEAK